jgi:hypothetical protein
MRQNGRPLSVESEKVSLYEFILALLWKINTDIAKNKIFLAFTTMNCMFFLRLTENAQSIGKNETVRC